MIEPDNDLGTYTIICDMPACGTENTYNADSWQDFIDQAKEDGWKIKRNGDEWEHFCPDCAQEN
jgi:hypothetical protein